MKGHLRIAAATMSALALAGCGSMITNQPTPSPARSVAASGPPAHISTTGILVGANPGDHGLHTKWTADAWHVASVAGQSAARVIVDRFGTGPDSSEVLFNAPLASTSGRNKLITQTQVKHAETEMVRAFDQEQDVAIPGQIDLISGILKMESHLGEVGAVNPDVIVFGNAVQTAGPANLADPINLADPSLTLEKAKADETLQASACRGWNVYMVDPSPAGFSGLQDEQLREFWREFFAACGGHLVLWDSTLIFPANGQIPPVRWATPGHRKVIIPLPAALLFGPNRSVLLPSARQTLDELCRDLVSAYPASRAEIDGYTAAIGGGDGMALSQARARAVASYLEACGVSSSRLSAHGHGDHGQVPGGLAANRRVVVTMQVG